MRNITIFRGSRKTTSLTNNEARIRALEEFISEWVKTTIPFHFKLMDDPGFKSGEFTTAFMESFDLSDL